MSKLIINDVMQQTFEQYKKNEEYMDGVITKSKTEDQLIYVSLKSIFDSKNKNGYILL